MPVWVCMQGGAAVAAVMTESSIPGYTTQILTGQQAKETNPLRDSDNSGTSVSNPYNARIGVLRELHSRKSDRSCIHVELDIQGSGIHYEAGDHVGLLCENGPGIVQEASRILGIPLDTVFSLQLPEGNPHELALPFPGTASIARCLHTLVLDHSCHTTSRQSPQTRAPCKCFVNA